MPIIEVPSGAIFATLVGFVAAAIVIGTLFGIPLPLVGSDRRALVALVAVGAAMCAVGGWATAPIPPGPSAVVASLAGVLTLVVLFAVVNGWSVILDPIAGVFYGTSAHGIADRVGVLAVGVLIAIAWLAATLRQIGFVPAS